MLDKEHDINEHLKGLRIVDEKRWYRKESAQNKIAEAICDLLREELADTTRNTDYPSRAFFSLNGDKFHCRQRFWDEVIDFPDIGVIPEDHRFEFLGGDMVERFARVRIRCFASKENIYTRGNFKTHYPDRPIIDYLFVLLKDIETILECFSGNLKYDISNSHNFEESNDRAADALLEPIPANPPENTKSLLEASQDELRIPARDFTVPVRYYTLNGKEYKVLEVNSAEGRFFQVYLYNKKDSDGELCLPDQPENKFVAVQDKPEEIIASFYDAENDQWRQVDRYIKKTVDQSKDLTIIDLRIEDISTDEGVLDPRAVGDLVCEIRY